MAEVINANFHNSLENLKSKNKKHIEELDMKCRIEEKIHKVLLADLNNQDWTRCRSSFEELSNNSKEIHQMMRTQNKIAEDTFSLTEKFEEKVQILQGRVASLENSSEDSSKTNRILVYGDWVVILIDQIIVPQFMGGQNDWDKIVNIFTKSICQNTDYYLLENEEEDKLFERLDEILKKVKMTLGEFEYLIRLNKKRNLQFHKNDQSLDEAKRQLEMTFPKDLECYKEPLKKALCAIEVKWKNNRNGNGNRRFKRNQ
ncbi:hypothetical protein RhiirA1_429905 [Rhizophagus irregularis]|uniref:Uncharacterized protein n=4 Tax=Rhizophagus irregularis TaxID=588596 RepID=U9UZ00_RHIID|nr:hypothetical protein GLOIN_2v1636702 [Rhizophagus irregularis DAOM 181602=DAOM 197198]EXX78342.1 hypothetical protein RirG_015830 [Rhizophagus irregularis DAOM 197198w]PKC54359.1 hypothetical protein RhiirA1_429905 [Rhizophagus irregularis]PKY34221.1 hypothetical protein RhiirB3_420803 [Rhizophagus irregularis]POG68565.1 hypothetical protein GLOIN_2v1636702 [Rhizophagus irregularis DAOM 181602=DAOM 197198]UZO27413.1 hypothetical protein OCT59_019611 [Rhizophagus irregularis]|eukprot:XP_025175431.1 hypothetical protein GLOIN_2v1636702 [Rhizophagus irregularis DAOM 181602=DAOM 197198]